MLVIVDALMARGWGLGNAQENHTLDPQSGLATTCQCGVRCTFSVAYFFHNSLIEGLATCPAASARLTTGP
eukprot:9229903-Prorocentrum_lima.AAC.1